MSDYYSDMGAYEAAIGYEAASHHNTQAEYEISIAWVSWIEQRLTRSLINADRKKFLRDRLEQSRDENEIKSILKEAEENQPIVGRDVWPQGQNEEMRQAIKFRADLDDFYDRTLTKNTDGREL
jgi:hypothetical protein